MISSDTTCPQCDAPFLNLFPIFDCSGSYAGKFQCHLCSCQFKVEGISEGNQIPPQYYGYKGGYDNVNRCRECGRTALDHDMHCVDPCPNCGGEVREGLVGKWIKPKYKLFWLRRKLIKKGYWKLK